MSADIDTRRTVALEGLHAVKHASRFGGEPYDVRVADRAAAIAQAQAVAPDLVDVLERADEVGDKGIGAATRRPVPTGVIATARRPPADLVKALGAAGPVVLLDRPRDPGNVGAAIRVAAAAGAAAVVVTGDLDPWHPVCVRGAAGLQFAQPVVRVDDVPDDLCGRMLVAVDPDGTEQLGGRERFERPAVFVFGTERGGLDDAMLARADVTLAIPMRAGVSSLNLATSVAVVLYAVDASTG
jgi:TrmH family RNA methyltransferase